MPSKRPAISVRLDQEDYDLVRRAAIASRRSMASLVADYVEMSRPMLKHLVDVADALEQAVSDRRELFIERVDSAMVEGQALADVAAGQLFMSYDTEVPTPDDLEPASEGADPPITNRGVTTPKPPINTTKQKKRGSGE